MSDFYGTGAEATAGDLTSTRQMDKYTDWLQGEFKPLELATPLATQEQCVENAIRYWNTHSGYKISDVYSYTSGTKRVQLDTGFKTVVNVYPTKAATWIWKDNPLWSLMGMMVLDNVTTDLIIMTEAFRNYKLYVGMDMRWTYRKSDDPSIGGYLYVINIPSASQSIFVVGTKRITANEDIKPEPILDWILNYSKALLRIIEGNTLRKSSIIEVKNDGQELVNEGKEEVKELKEELASSGRWVALAKRR